MFWGPLYCGGSRGHNTHSLLWGPHVLLLAVFLPTNFQDRLRSDGRLLFGALAGRLLFGARWASTVWGPLGVYCLGPAGRVLFFY